MEGRRTLLRAAAVIARLMVCLLIILAMVRIGRYAYSVGYQVFGQRQGQAEEPGETLPWTLQKVWGQKRSAACPRKGTG